MNKYLKYISIISVFSLGCKVNKKVVDKNSNYQHEMITLNGIDVEFKEGKKSFELFQKSDNYLDVYFYEYFHKSNISKISRIVQAKSTDEMRMYSVKNDSLIEIKSVPENIKDPILNWENRGNYMIYPNLLSYDTKVLYCKKNGKTIFILLTHEYPLFLKSEDYEKIGNGSVLMESLSKLKY